jgi:hypothetical protein
VLSCCDSHLLSAHDLLLAGTADISGLFLTDEEKQAKTDLLRDREALRYAEFFCGDRCYTTSDHARVSPYHSSRLARIKRKSDGESGVSDDEGPSHSSKTKTVGTRSPASSHRLQTSPQGPNCRLQDVGDNGRGAMKSGSGLSTSHMWPLLKLVHADTESNVLEQAGSWSCERVAIFLSQTNADSLSTDMLESMRGQGMNGLALLNSTDSLLLHRYGIRSKQQRKAVCSASTLRISHVRMCVHLYK